MCERPVVVKGHSQGRRGIITSGGTYYYWFMESHGQATATTPKATNFIVVEAKSGFKASGTTGSSTTTGSAGTGTRTGTSRSSSGFRSSCKAQTGK